MAGSAVKYDGRAWDVPQALLKQRHTPYRLFHHASRSMVKKSVLTQGWDAFEKTIQIHTHHPPRTLFLSKGL